MDWRECLVRQHALFMAVTQDKYELPLAVADSMGELSRLRGVDITAVTRSIHRPIKNSRRRKYICVVLSEEDYREAVAE